MRERAAGDILHVRAIAGTYVVVLAWDFVTGQEDRRNGLLGFAVQREQLGGNGAVVERYWMTGIKRFKDKDRGLAPGTPVSTAEHPFQGFQWARLHRGNGSDLSLPCGASLRGGEACR